MKSIMKVVWALALAEALGENFGDVSCMCSQIAAGFAKDLITE